MAVDKLKEGSLISFNHQFSRSIVLPYTGVYEGIGIEYNDGTYPVMLVRVDGGDGEIEKFLFSELSSIEELTGDVSEEWSKLR